MGEQAPGRRILVTGAASGIGEGIARRLLDDGDDVLVVDREAEGLKPLGDLGASAHVLDLADSAARQELVPGLARSTASSTRRASSASSRSSTQPSSCGTT